MWLCCSDLNWDDAELFGFEGEVKRAKVVSVYDGDSVKVTFPVKGKMYKWNCRISGIDTPELRTKDPEEKIRAFVIRDALRVKILNKVVVITCGKFDKYGRLLVDISTDGVSITEWLLSKGYGYAYNGGTKQIKNKPHLLV